MTDELMKLFVIHLCFSNEIEDEFWGVFESLERAQEEIRDSSTLESAKCYVEQADADTGYWEINEVRLNHTNETPLGFWSLDGNLLSEQV